MRTFHAGLPVLFLALLLTACAGPRGSGESSQQGDRNMITQEQIRSGNYATAFEAVQALRSHWLRNRGPDSFTSPGQIQVYRDETRIGGVTALHSMAAAGIGHIRYYDGIAATSRWGMDHGHGVIYVSSRPP